MHLKKLEMFGFKSFPEKLAIEVGNGIMAVVGPNGCGKSNIVDAIRWGLGEQSARILRGESMGDVIFAGSKTRKPLGMAQVALTFSNDEGKLPVEFSEVTISRRVFRSGESEYMLNKGVPAERVIAAGYGETQPIDTNRTPAGREKNRRVEFNLIDAEDDE